MHEYIMKFEIFIHAIIAYTHVLWISVSSQDNFNPEYINMFLPPEIFEKVHLPPPPLNIALLPRPPSFFLPQVGGW